MRNWSPTISSGLTPRKSHWRNAQYLLDKDAKQKEDTQELSDKQAAAAAAAKAWAERPKYPEPKDELKLVCGGQFIIVDLARHNVFFADGDNSVPTQIFSSGGRYYRDAKYENDSASVSVTQAAITFRNSSGFYTSSSSSSQSSEYRIDRYNATWHYDHSSNYSYETVATLISPVPSYQLRRRLIPFETKMRMIKNASRQARLSPLSKTHGC